MEEKAELLEEVASAYDMSGELDWDLLVVTILSMVIVLLLIFPKIYIASNIYFESVEIERLKKEYTILSEENKILTQKIEEKKFSNE